MNDRKIRVYVFQKKKIAHNCFFFCKSLFIYLFCCFFLFLFSFFFSLFLFLFFVFNIFFFLVNFSYYYHCTKEKKTTLFFLAVLPWYFLVHFTFFSTIFTFFHPLFRSLTLILSHSSFSSATPSPLLLFSFLLSFFFLHFSQLSSSVTASTVFF